MTRELATNRERLEKIPARAPVTPIGDGLGGVIADVDPFQLHQPQAELSISVSIEVTNDQATLSGVADQHNVAHFLLEAAETPQKVLVIVKVAKGARR